MRFNVSLGLASVAVGMTCGYQASIILAILSIRVRRVLVMDTSKDIGSNYALLMRPLPMPTLPVDFGTVRMSNYESVHTGLLRHFVPEFRGSISTELASWFNVCFKHAVNIGMADTEVRCNVNGGHPVTRYLEDVFKYKAMHSAVTCVLSGMYDRVTDCGAKVGKFNHLFCSALEFEGFSSRRDAGRVDRTIELVSLCPKVIVSDPADVPDAPGDRVYTRSGYSIRIVHRVIRSTLQEYEEVDLVRTCHFVNDAHYYMPGYRVRNTCFVAGMAFSNLPGLHHLPCGEGYVEITNEGAHQRVSMTTAQNEKARYCHDNVVINQTARAAFSVGYLQWGFWCIQPGEVLCYKVPSVRLRNERVSWSASRFTAIAQRTWTPEQMLALVPRHVADDCRALEYHPDGLETLREYRGLVESCACDGVDFIPRFDARYSCPDWLNVLFEVDLRLLMLYLQAPFFDWYLGFRHSVGRLRVGPRILYRRARIPDNFRAVPPREVVAREPAVRVPVNNELVELLPLVIIQPIEVPREGQAVD